MAPTNQREHERIDIRMHTRIWRDETVQGKAVNFEGFAHTRDLAIGGTFLEASYLLAVGCPINLEMTIDENDTLSARGEVVHTLSGEGSVSGMGILFTEVDAENRERLLRFFVSDRVKEFYHTRFLMEFPHLEDNLSLKDVALVINLWEDREGRLTALRHPESAKAQQARRREVVKATEKRASRKH